MVTSLIIGLEAIGFSTAMATFAVNFAVSYVVTRAFADNPEQQQDMGVRQQVPPSAVNAIPIVYGNAYMGGTFVDAVLTTDQKTMYYVLAISSISPNGQFAFDTADMYYGDRKITFDGSDLTKVVSLTDEAGNVDTKISGNLYINLYTSTAGGTITSANGASAPSTVMGGSDIAVGQRWTGTRQMNGLGFAIVKLIYNRDADTTQLQPITFKVSHTLNGTGVAKAGDVWYDYITNSVYGGAVDAAFVNSTSATALNAYGDQTITFTNSSGAPSTQPRYRINGVLDAGQTVLSNIDRIVSACDSWMTYNAALGQWSIVINKAESTAYAFDDDNIIGEIRVSATDITSSINQVEARFPFKENRDQAAFVNIETPSGLLYPNEPVNKYSITYDMVNDSVQANYLANRLLEQAREDLIVSFSTTYYGIQVDAGDVVSVTNADYGWNAKLFRVMKVNEASLPDGSLGAKLELTEYNAQVYDDQDITQFTPVPNSGLSSPVFFSALSAPTVTASRPSDAVPSFDIQISIPATGRVTFGTLFYTIDPSNSLAWKVLDSASSPNNTPVTNSTNYTFANQVLPAGTFYFTYTVGNEIASSQRSANSAAFVWSPTGASGPAGENGLTALTAYLVQSQSSATPTFTTPTTGATAPSGWSLSAPAVSVGQVMWYIQGRYNSNAVTVDGVAAGKTAWTGPVAASIFQDIRSDNWNGSTPPTYGTPVSYGTTGYYIQQSTGDVFFNNGIFRADINTDGDATFKGQTLTTQTIIVNGVVYYMDYSSYSEAISTPTTDAMRVGSYGYANASPNLSVKPIAYNVGVLGEGKNKFGAKGYGVIGKGDEVGGYFESSGIGAILNGNGVTPIGVAIAGGLQWGIYTYPVPTGSTTTFLRNDGTWAVPAGGGGGSGTVTSVATSGTVSGITLTGGPITTSGTITLGGTLAVAASDITSGTIATARLGTGTANTTTFLRGDNTWSASTNNFGLSPSSGTGYSNTFSFFTGGTGITVTGNGTDRLTFDVTSDARLKYDIDFDNEDYKTIIPAIKIAKYKRNDKRDYKPDDYIEHGTTAQSAETVCSYLVNLTNHEDSDSIKAVNYQSIFAMNVKYTQYLQQQIDLLKAEIDLLKTRIT
jgi:hypothetical protein